MVAWNVNGLGVSTLLLWDTATYLNQFDVVLMSEVRLACWDDALLPNHSVAFIPASSDGRAGEGIVVAVQKSCHYQVLDASSETHTGLWVKLQFRGSATPLLLASVYIPPAGSAQLRAIDPSQRFDNLATQALAACAEGHVLVAGDFNARVGSRADCPVGSARARGSTDGVVNTHGRRLLDFCNVTGLRLCTGRVQGDFGGRPTFTGRRNTLGTRPDHVLVSKHLLPFVTCCKVNESRHDSDHLPIEVTLDVSWAVAPATPVMCSGRPLTCVQWQPRQQIAYAAALHCVAAPHLAACREAAMAGHVEAAFSALDKGVRAAAAASNMPARTLAGSASRAPRVRAPFFDDECRQLRRQVRASTRNGGDPGASKALERAYHSKVRFKSRAHRLARLHCLLHELQYDPRAFWHQLRPVPNELPMPLQSVQVWDSYLNHIASMDPAPHCTTLPFNAYPVHPAAPSSLLEALDGPISMEEVQSGLQHLHNGRACGWDGLPAELLRYAKGESSPHVLAPVLKDLLNAAFLAGRVPACLNCGLVTPVFKKGDRLDTANYRPIAVTDSILRLYAGVLNARLLNFTEEAGLRVDTQTGFRPGLSTVHHLFTLQHFIDAQQPLFVCFLDLKGAYDHVNRDLLWEALRRLGISGRLLGALQSMYEGCSVAIKVGGRVSPGLPSRLGLKQGCPLSPTLFGLFSDGLHRHLVHACPGVGPQLHNGRNVPLLGYADDFVLLATTPAGLQCSIHAVFQLCQAIGMVVSTDKTQVMVFSPRMVDPYQWSCGGVILQCVQQYKYLGIVFDAVHGIGSAFDKLRSKMLGSWALLRRQYGTLRCVRSVGLLLRLYNAYVPPAGSYGCEVWGLRVLPASTSRKGRDALGSLHVKILRALAFAPASVSIAVLMRELDQRPLSEMWWQRVVSFWNSVCNLPHDSLYRQVALDDVSDANTRHVRNWAWSFRHGLHALGYEFGSTTLLPVCFDSVVQLLATPTAHLWDTLDFCPRTCPSHNATLCTYLRWFAKPVGLRPSPSLLQLPISARCMRILLRFRMGCHSLPIVMGRRSGVPRSQRVCLQCDLHVVGDERHMVFDCTALQPVRERYLDLFGPNIITMQQFMWQRDLIRVAHFVLACFDSLHSLSGGQ